MNDISRKKAKIERKKANKSARKRFVKIIKLIFGKWK